MLKQLKNTRNEVDFLSAFSAKLVAVFTSLITMITAICFPPESITPEFPETSTQVKTAFDEGEFVMGTYDLVAPYGNDSNAGTKTLFE